MMKHGYLLTVALLSLQFTGQAQCTIDLPQDTVTIYWGYDPLACTTLTPTVGGAAPTALLWSNGATSTSITVCDTAGTWYFVTLTDDTLCTATDSVFVNVVDVHCGNNNNKVLVCHIPPGNPDNAHTICISENGVPAHLAHGCVLGACAATPDSLGQNDLDLYISPNPMSDRATVRVRTTVAQRVNVSVVDALGRRSVVLLDTDMAAGEERTVTLDPSVLPGATASGWLEAQGSTGRQVHRFTLLR